MKKLLIALLVVAMALTMITACSKKEESGTAASGTDSITTEPETDPTDKPSEDSTDVAPTEEGNTDEPSGELALPAVFYDFEKKEIDDLTNTTWTFSGGIEEGAQMDEEAANNYIALMGGSFEIVFLDNNALKVVAGAFQIDGTYEIVNGGTVVKTSEFPGVGAYLGIFVEVDGEPVMVVSNNEPTSTVAFYMTMENIEEA